VLVTERGGRTPGFAGAPLRPPPALEHFTPEAMPSPVPAYPGNYAVPGLMWPGFALPAQPVTGFVEGVWLFTGNYTCTYPQHIDATTEVTLVAQPGVGYDINPVGGDPGVSEPPGDGRWVLNPL
jgi:hypothetical protein